MASVLRLGKTWVKNAQNIEAVYRTFLRGISQFETQLSTESMPKAEIATLPDHFQHYAYQTPDSILSSSTFRNNDYYSSVGLLKALKVQIFLKNTTVEEIRSDNRFTQLCMLFESHCQKFNPALLVSGLRSLLEIGIPPGSDVIKNIDQVILLKIDEFDVIQLVSCLHLHSKFVSPHMKQDVIPALVATLREKVKDVRTPAEAHMLLQMLHLFDLDFLKILQDKLVEIVNEMDMPNLIKVIEAISGGNQRNKSLLTAAAAKLVQCEIKPSLKETASILHDLNSLNFYDKKLLLSLTSDRESEIRDVEQPALISALLNACGQLKWRHAGFLDACGQWLMDHSEVCDQREFVSFILTIAALNYFPTDPRVIEHILPQLSYENIGNKDIWLDVVWSLAVLNRLDKAMLVHVLSPQFHQSLLADKSFGSVSKNLKLMNLKSLLKTLHPEYVFSCDLYVDAQEVVKGKESENCREQVLTALNSVAPKGKFMEDRVNTDMGVTIDAEFILTTKEKPLLLALYGLKGKPVAAQKRLPKGAKRIALMVWQFRDYTLNEQVLTGINAMAVRLLSAEGYVIVQVPYHEFVQQPTFVKKVVYLSQLISEAKKESEKDP